MEQELHCIFHYYNRSSLHLTREKEEDRKVKEGTFLKVTIIFRGSPHICILRARAFLSYFLRIVERR